MFIESTAVLKSGYFEEKYGMHGTQKSAKDKATLSFPFSIKDAPEGTKSFAGIFYDLDDCACSGCVWIHWTFCDLKDTDVPENASQEHPEMFTQGSTTFHSLGWDETVEEASCYGGPAPEGDHEYTLCIFALDTELGLEKSFFMNEMIHKMEGHVLAKAELKGRYAE